MLNRHAVLGLVRVLNPIESEVLKNKIVTLYCCMLLFKGCCIQLTIPFTLLCQKKWSHQTKKHCHRNTNKHDINLYIVPFTLKKSIPEQERIWRHMHTLFCELGLFQFCLKPNYNSDTKLGLSRWRAEME